METYYIQNYIRMPINICKMIIGQFYYKTPSRINHLFLVLLVFVPSSIIWYRKVVEMPFLWHLHIGFIQIKTIFEWVSKFEVRLPKFKFKLIHQSSNFYHTETMYTPGKWPYISKGFYIFYFFLGFSIAVLPTYIICLYVYCIPNYSALMNFPILYVFPQGTRQSKHLNIWL